MLKFEEIERKIAVCCFLPLCGFLQFSQPFIGLETKVGGVLKSWDPEDSENGAGCEDWPSNSWEN